MEAFVIGRRQTEHAEQCSIAPSRVLEAAMDQCREIVTREFVRFERLMYDGPETLARDQTFPETIRRARAALGPSRARRNILVR